MKKSTIIGIASAAVAVCGIAAGAFVVRKAITAKKNHTTGESDFDTELPTKDNTPEVPYDYSNALGIGLNEVQTAIFNKATAEVKDAAYTPLACLGGQVVAGMNYGYLCVETKDDAKQIVLVYVYNNLFGNSEILSIKPLFASFEETPTDVEDFRVEHNMTVSFAGGWTINTDAPLVDNSLENRAFGRAVEKLDGICMEELAFLGSRLKNGTERLFVCRETSLRDDKDSALVCIVVLEDETGDATITEKHYVKLSAQE